MAAYSEQASLLQAATAGDCFQADELPDRAGDAEGAAGAWRQGEFVCVRWWELEETGAGKGIYA